MSEPKAPVTVRMVNPDGEAYDIPRDMQAKAFADGLREDKGIVDKVLDVGHDLNLPRKIWEGLSGTGQQLGDVAKQYGQQVLIGGDGHAYVMPADVAKKAIEDSMKQGGPEFRVPDLAMQGERELVARAEANIDPSNQGIRGTLKTAHETAQNAFAKAATFGAIDPENDALTDTQRAAFQQSQEMNPTAAAAGGAVGFASGMIADPFAVGGAATKAGGIAEKALVGEAKTFGSRVLAGMIRTGTEGAVVSMPHAGRQLVEGNVEGAAESLLTGIGIGALFGAAGPVANKLTRGATESVALKAEQLASKLEGSSEALGELADAGVQKATKYVGGAIGGAVGGFPGAAAGFVAGKVAGKVLSPLAEKLAADPRTASALQQIAKAVGSSMRELPAVLENIGSSKLGQAAELGSINAVTKLLGSSSSKATKQEQFTDLQEKVVKLATDAEHRVDAVAKATPNANGINPEVSQAYADKAHQAIDYLYGSMPKDPKAQGLFTGKAQWMPSDAEMSRFGRKLEVVQNPFAVLNELKTGTLTKDHVEALDGVYPTIANEFRAQVAKLAASPNPPTMSKAQRAQLAILMKGPLDGSQQPKSVARYQSAYAPEAQDDKAPGKVSKLNVGKLPSSMTEAQRISLKAG